MVEKHLDILEKVKFSESPTPEVIFEQAAANKYNLGVLAQDGSSKITYNIFVDNSLYTKIKDFIFVAMADSIEALYQVLGFPDKLSRQDCLSLE